MIESQKGWRHEVIDMEYLRDSVEKLMLIPWVKGMAGLFIWFLHACYGNELKWIYVSLPILILADFLVGTIGDWFDPTKVPCRRRFRAGCLKFGIYGLILLVLYQFGKHPAISPIQSGAEALILITEGIAVLEKVDRLTTLFGCELPILKTIISFTKGKTEGLMK